MKYRKKPVVIEAYQTDKEMDIEMFPDEFYNKEKELFL